MEDLLDLFFGRDCVVAIKRSHDGNAKITSKSLDERIGAPSLREVREGLDFEVVSISEGFFELSCDGSASAVARLFRRDKLASNQAREEE